MMQQVLRMASTCSSAEAVAPPSGTCLDMASKHSCRQENTDGTAGESGCSMYACHNCEARMQVKCKHGSSPSSSERQAPREALSLH